jgi:hypothetical protein
MEWKIDNFLQWSNTKAAGYREHSPVFSFDFPAIKKTFIFQLVLQPKLLGQLVGLYLQNNNNETLHIKLSMSSVDSAGRTNKK